MMHNFCQATVVGKSALLIILTFVLFDSSVACFHSNRWIHSMKWNKIKLMNEIKLARISWVILVFATIFECKMKIFWKKSPKNIEIFFKIKNQINIESVKATLHSNLKQLHWTLSFWIFTKANSPLYFDIYISSTIHHAYLNSTQSFWHNHLTPKTIPTTYPRTVIYQLHQLINISEI